jgi:hypothetical protein
MLNVDLSIHDFDGRAVVALRGELNLASASICAWRRWAGDLRGLFLVRGALARDPAGLGACGCRAGNVGARRLHAGGSRAGR